MARRRITTDRLIATLGGLVVVLGLVMIWIVTRPGNGFVEEAPADRVLRQARELLGPRAEVQLVQSGRGRVVCGYVAASQGETGQPFVSRPNRMMLMSDPLPAEFREAVQSECPDLPHPPAVQAVHD
ncbi:hypothetical protein GVN24_33020 [Rhizobium sp. CRIBSB]|nr:hypothetical protein [Rhizobium sp. CRIBSB]